MKQATNQLLIRADVGPGVGTGHLMRTIALGQAWSQNGGEVTVVCGEIPRGLLRRIEAEKFSVQILQNSLCDEADSSELLDVVTSITPNWIVVDGYRFDDEYQKATKTSGSQLLVLDDYQHAQHHHADLILNQNIYADLDQYETSSHSKILAGPSYALLRDEFSKLTPKRTAVEARRLLVTFGGADPDNWTLKTLQSLSDLERKRMVVDCVVGACYSNTRELDIFKKSANMNLRIHRNVDRMTTLMSRVDLAITAGGSTCYELARCGVPAVVIAIADNQIPIACAMDDQGIMVSIAGDSGNTLGTTINQLLKDPVAREAMSKRGQSLVDGRGAQRIVGEMVSMQDANNRIQIAPVDAVSEEKSMSPTRSLEFNFREASIEDAKSILQWRNDPEVRSVSFHNDFISLADHQQWMAEKLADANTKIWISEDEAGKAIGQLRFDFSQNGEQAVISIIVDQARRGRGFGRMLITSSTRKIFATTKTQTIIAQIKPGNTASERAFRAAGFRAIEPTIVNGKMALQYSLDRDAQQQSLPARKSA